MKKKLLFLCLLLLPARAVAQRFPPNFNLVPNPAFELWLDPYNYTTSIVDTEFKDNPRCWMVANQFPAGLWHKLSTGKNVLTKAHSGIAFARILYSGDTVWAHTTESKSQKESRTFLESMVYEPLEPGVVYTFRMFVGGSTSDSNFFNQLTEITNIGVYFSWDKIHEPTWGRLSVKPQINFDWQLKLKDTFYYQELTATYTAKGGEQYLVIGNFDHFREFRGPFKASTPNGDTGRISSLFFIDDVSLVRDATQKMISLDYFDLGKDTFLCTNDPILIGGQPNFFHYLWNTGDTSRLLQVQRSGKYWCTVDYGCGFYTDTINVVYLPVVLRPDLGRDTFNCTEYGLLQEVRLSVDSFAHTRFRWSNGDTLSHTTIKRPGMYWVEASNGCSALRDTIQLLGCPPEEVPNIPVPNAFSPNGDGLNDVFRLPFVRAHITDLHMHIYNRYGREQATLNSPDDKWDGGNSEVGVYFYLLQYRDTTGKWHTQKGDITLLR